MSSHLMAVAALVIEDGGDEDQAIAALLHDAEDQGGQATLDRNPALFGDRVADIVDGCTDTFSTQARLAAAQRSLPGTPAQRLAGGAAGIAGG